jgi:hypothetical protein
MFVDCFLWHWQHIFDSQIRLHGREPADSLIRVAPRAGEHSLRTEDILAVIAEHGASTAVVCFRFDFHSGSKIHYHPSVDIV